MSKDKIVEEIILSYFNVSKKSISALSEHVEFLTIPRNTLFVKSGVSNDYDYFLLDGICRSQVVNQKGEEITLSFFQDKTVLTPNVARIFNHQSTLSFEALTDIETGRFKSIELVKLMRINSELRSFANAVLQNELTLKSNKEISNASLTAKERLVLFREQYSSLENLIPHQAIASYLGITNISLSRLRNELSKA